jgi:Zn-dependent M28 family amino/carboxypeptidase
MNNQVKHIFITLSIVLFLSCNQSVKKEIMKQETTNENILQRPDFDRDSAYYFVEQQVKFTPRVPNTKAHKDCATFLINTLKMYADTVLTQPLKIKAYNGTLLNGQNIIGIFNPEAQKRVLLAAHWDSRPYADHDPDSENWRTPIDGANDGASGVGVLLEIARQLHLKSPKIGIDIIFFDLEDYGEPNDDRFNYTGENWCLGSQAWAKNPHTKNYKAKYGILLDMVSGKNAMFTKEGFSRQYAPDILDKVWNRANYLGFSSYFQNKDTYPILDDHFYVNKIRNIPMINIIEWSSSTEHGFNKYWHTINDNMDNINKETLYVVGTVVLSVVYGER